MKNGGIIGKMGGMMKIAVIFPAAGQSQRFGAGSKIEQNLAGKPVFLQAIEPFLKHPAVTQCIVAVNPDHLDAFKFKWNDKLGFRGVQIVAGGKIERWETVAKAMEAVPQDCTHVAVHDAARPLVDQALLDRVFEAAKHYPAVVPAVPVTATLKHTEALTPQEEHRSDDPLDAIMGQAGKTAVNVRKINRTIDRTDVVAVQTPQVFEIALLRKAYAAINAGDVQTNQITDDAGLVEAMGQNVFVVEGDPANLKITHPQDLALAQAIAEHRKRASSASLGKKRLFMLDDDD